MFTCVSAFYYYLRAFTSPYNAVCIHLDGDRSLLNTPEELRTARLGSGGPGRGPTQVDSPGPGRSRLGSAAQRPDPAAGSPRTERPSSFQPETHSNDKVI